MRKALLFCLFVLCGTMAFAQSASSNASDAKQWEVNAGANFASYNVTGYDSRVGFHLGIRRSIELPSVSNGVYANAGAFLSLKGCSVNMGILANAKANPYYLDIPVHIGYMYPVNENISLFGEVGPYLAIGLFGNTKASSPLLDAFEKEYGYYGYDYGYDYDDDDDFDGSGSEEFFKENNRIDYGIGLRAGIELQKQYVAAIGYDLGLANVDKGGFSMKTRNFYISVGYKF